MADLLQRYMSVIKKEIPIPSRLILILPDEDNPPGLSDVARYIQKTIDRPVKGRALPEKCGPAGQWAAGVTVQWDESNEREYTLWLEHKEDIHDFHFERGGFDEEDKTVINKSTWVIGVDTTFSEDCLADYHRQLKLVCALTPEFPAVLDAAACTLHPAAWIRETAANQTAPDPTNLFCIHAVYDDKDKSRPMWLHTHGLLRCGMFEWEMLGIDREKSGTFGQLLNYIVMFVMSQGPPAPDESFDVAQGMPLVWLPYERGIRHFPKTYEGTIASRDEFHTHPSAVVLARRKFLFFKRYASPALYGAQMEDNPLVSVSQEETERMAQLAREKLPDFLELFAHHGAAEDWGFLVKLGYRVDGAEDDSSREHLWFRVQAVKENRVLAELLNEPYQIAAMHEGDKGWHDLALLTDWTIMCRHGQFSPNKVMLLKKTLGKM